MNVCIVIVTYGNRYHLLHRVLASVLKDNVSKIIIVDNNSHKKCKQQLLTFTNNYPKLIDVIWHQENEGSAKGFSVGLEKASHNNECDFIWLLDDDNVPEQGALQVLFDSWCNWTGHDKEHNLCLLSNRKDRPLYKRMAAVDSSSIDRVNGSINAAFGFNLFHPYKTFQNYIFLKESNKEIQTPEKRRNGKVPVAPYGGMFFHKSLLDVIGYPNEEFIIYGDDWEFSHRIIQHNGEIVLIYNSIINDIDIPGNRGMQVDEANLFRIYYLNRNIVYFQKKLAAQNWVFNLNVVILAILLILKNIFHIITQKNIRTKMIIKLKAIKDGVKGKLGKKNDFRLS